MHFLCLSLGQSHTMKSLEKLQLEAVSVTILQHEAGSQTSVPVRTIMVISEAVQVGDSVYTHNKYEELAGKQLDQKIA